MTNAESMRMIMADRIHHQGKLLFQHIHNALFQLSTDMSYIYLLQCFVISGISRN